MRQRMCAVESIHREYGIWDNIEFGSITFDRIICIRSFGTISRRETNAGNAVASFGSVVEHRHSSPRLIWCTFFVEGWRRDGEGAHALAFTLLYLIVSSARYRLGLLGKLHFAVPNPPTASAASTWQDDAYSQQRLKLLVRHHFIAQWRISHYLRVRI